MVLAGDTIFAGGDATVAAYDANTGRETWRTSVNGAAHGLSVANGRLLVSTDTGAIYCFAPSSDSGAANIVPVATSSVDDPAAVRRERRRRTTIATRPKEGASPVAGVSGPFIRFTTPERVEITWHTAKPSATRAQFTLHPSDTKLKDLGDGQTRTDHTITIDPAPARVVTALRLALPSGGGDGAKWTEWYRLDTSLGYAPPVRESTHSPYPGNDALKSEVVASIELSRWVGSF